MAESFDDITLDDSGESFSDVTQRATASVRGLEASANGFARAMAQAFTSATIGGKRFEDVLKSLALRLSNMALTAAFKPLAQGLTSGFQSLFGNLFGGGGLGATTDADKAIAAVMASSQPFATGGVIASPTYFPLGAGRLGLAGEAGPEAILPLARGADGTLGVAAAGGAATASVTINIATPDAASFRRSETYLTGQIARAVARGQRGL
jgi:phage-related minor tail protein